MNKQYVDYLRKNKNALNQRQLVEDLFSHIDEQESVISQLEADAEKWRDYVARWKAIHELAGKCVQPDNREKGEF